MQRIIILYGESRRDNQRRRAHHLREQFGQGRNHGMRETAAKLLPLGPDDMYRKEPSDKVRYFKRDEEEVAAKVNRRMHWSSHS